jgi:hypothetical protein
MSGCTPRRPKSDSRETLTAGSLTGQTGQEEEEMREVRPCSLDAVWPVWPVMFPAKSSTIQNRQLCVLVKSPDTHALRGVWGVGAQALSVPAGLCPQNNQTLLFLIDKRSSGQGLTVHGKNARTYAPLTLEKVGFDFGHQVPPVPPVPPACLSSAIAIPPSAPAARAARATRPSWATQPHHALQTLTPAQREGYTYACAL